MKPIKTLPISQAQNEIELSILENDVTFINTPTGSGKTMFVPYWAFMLTGKQVFCTVPRVKLAQEASLGVVAMWGKPLAGYATGQKDDNTNRPVIYITEGSFIMRDLAASLVAGQVVCIDEVHEQGANLEALLFKVKELAARGVKVVLMSATLDTPKYTKMYEGLSVGVVQLPPAERPFETEIVIVDNPMQAVCDAANAGGRVLVGLAGKEDIEQYIAGLARMKCTAEIFPIHGEIELDTQDKALRYKGACVYVCTNIVQSGLTIFGLTHGYFSGQGKRIEIRNGENSLVEYKLSVAEMTQWRGRLGRTCKGTIIVPNETERDLLGRDAMPTAEILRSNLDETILSFAVMGLRLQDCSLLNMPSKESIDNSLATLVALGLADLDGTVNAYGLKVAKCGAGLRGGIVTIKGRELGIENTARKLAAVSSMRSFLSFDKVQTPMSFIKTILGQAYEAVKHSDHLILMGVVEYFAGKYGKETAKGLRIDPSMLGQFIEECTANFIFRRTLEQLVSVFGRINNDCANAKTLTIEAANNVLRAMYADQILKLSYGTLEDSKGYARKTGDSNKAVRMNQTEAVGNLTSIETRRGVLRLVEMVTYLDSAPVTTTTPPTFDKDKMEVVTVTETKVNGVVTETSKETCKFSLETAKVLLNNIHSIPEFAPIHTANKAVVAELDDLHIRSCGDIAKVDYAAWLLERLVAIEAVGRTEVVCDLETLTLKLEDIITHDEVDFTRLCTPNEISGFQVEYIKDGGKFEAKMIVPELDAQVIEALPTVIESAHTLWYLHGYTRYNCEGDLIALLEKQLERSFNDLQNESVSFDGMAGFVGITTKEWKGGVAYLGVKHYYSNRFQTWFYKTETEALDSVQACLAIDAEYNESKRVEAVSRWNRYNGTTWDDEENLPSMDIEAIEYDGVQMFIGYVVSNHYLEVRYRKIAALDSVTIETQRSFETIEKFKALVVEISDFQYCDDRSDIEEFAVGRGKRKILSEIQSLTDRARNFCYDLDVEAYRLFEQAKKLFASLETEYREDRAANNPFAAAFAKLKK